MQKKHLKTLFYILFFTSFFGLGVYSTLHLKKSSAIALQQAKEEAPTVIPLEEAFPYVLAPRSTLFAALRELDINPQTIRQIVDAAKPIENLSRLRPGIRFQIVRAPETNELTEIEFRFSALQKLNIKKLGNTWTAQRINEKVDIRVISFSGTVTSSLWESAQRVKMDPNLIAELADILGWEVDFAREVRINDRWRLTVEQKVVRGEPVGWGAILAAEYVNDGTSYQAVLFRNNGEEIGYFTPEGASLRKQFLKSPIRYGRITSGFNRKRFHPILQVSRPHLGVDYAAPIGTPIRTVGDGTVLYAKRSGGAGNVVRIRHNATYQTVYKHLHGFAKGIHSGAKVKQGQIIGYVGNTGLSTGPHLHFEFYQAGNYIDPLKKKFSSADPVPLANIEQFKSEASVLLAALPEWGALDISEARIPATNNTHPN